MDDDAIAEGAILYSNDEFCIKDDEFCIKNDELLKSMVILQVIGNLGCVYLVVITVLIYADVLDGCNAPEDGSRAGYYDEWASVMNAVDLLQVGDGATPVANITPPQRSALACGGDLTLDPPVRAQALPTSYNIVIPRDAPHHYTELDLFGTGGSF